MNPSPPEILWISLDSHATSFWRDIQSDRKTVHLVQSQLSQEQWPAICGAHSGKWPKEGLCRTSNWNAGFVKNGTVTRDHRNTMPWTMDVRHWRSVIYCCALPVVLDNFWGWTATNEPKCGNQIVLVIFWLNHAALCTLIFYAKDSSPAFQLKSVDKKCEIKSEICFVRCQIAIITTWISECDACEHAHELGCMETFTNLM